MAAAEEEPREPAVPPGDRQTVSEPLVCRLSDPTFSSKLGFNIV